jgi:hypothetical protein
MKGTHLVWTTFSIVKLMKKRKKKKKKEEEEKNVAWTWCTNEINY